jgi:CheY-like chemotaxis protein
MGTAMRADSGCDRTLTVLVTSAGWRGDAARARVRGFAAYLTKPLDWGPLGAALAEVLRRAEAAELGATPELVTLHSMAETQRGALRILLVEDSAVNQLVTQWTLKRLGYSLQIAPTAREALEAWKRERFDLVLLDLRLPDGDGYSVAGEMRACEAAGCRAPIVALTASNGPGERERCVAAGMDEHIAKPVDLGQLCRLVRSLTGGSSDVAGETTLVVPARDAGDPGKAAVVADDTPLLHAIEAAEAEASGVRPACPAPIPLSSADVVPLAADAAPSESAATTPLPAIDLARLETASVGLPAVRESLLSSFLEEVRPRLERLGQAVSERDGERVEHEAHGLKGMCATVGATACTDRFAELERLGRERALDLAPALLKQAHLEVTRAERYITDLERPAA